MNWNLKEDWPYLAMGIMIIVYISGVSTFV